MAGAPRRLAVTAEVPFVCVREADAVVTTGCGDASPVYPGTRRLDRQLDDPAGRGVGAVRPVRDGIRRRVAALLEELVPEG